MPELYITLSPGATDPEVSVPAVFGLRISAITACIFRILPCTTPLFPDKLTANKNGKEGNDPWSF
jgi:hypothetical protein